MNYIFIFFFILGEGMTSALVWTDFYKIAKEVGFTQPCLVSISPLPICDKKYREALGELFFYYCSWYKSCKFTLNQILFYHNDVISISTS